MNTLGNELSNWNIHQSKFPPSLFLLLLLLVQLGLSVETLLAQTSSVLGLQCAPQNLAPNHLLYFQILSVSSILRYIIHYC